MFLVKFGGRPCGHTPFFLTFPLFSSFFRKRATFSTRLKSGKVRKTAFFGKKGGFRKFRLGTKKWPVARLDFGSRGLRK